MNSTLSYTEAVHCDKKSSVLDYFLIFWMIYTSGIVTFAYNNYAFFMLGTVACIVVTLLKPIKFQKRDQMLLGLFVLLELISVVQLIISMSEGHIYLGSLKMMVTFLLIFLYCFRFTLKQFAHIFSNIILIIAGISLVFYWFNSAIIAADIFPRVRVDDITVYVNLFVYCCDIAIPHRNCGVFWEPGAFQIYLNLALLFVLNNKDISKRGMRIIILVLALLTTISTTGYICAALIIISYFLKSNIKAKFKVLIFILAIFMAVGGVILPIVIESFSYKFGLNGMSVSGNVTSRVNTVLLDFRVMFHHPIGLRGLDYYADTLREYSVIYALPYMSSSCTPTTIAVVYGIIPGILVLLGIFWFGKNTFFENIGWLAVLSVFLMFTTESFLTFSLFYFLAFNGYKGRTT